MNETYHIEPQPLPRAPKCPKHGTRLVLPNFHTARVCLECRPSYRRACGICRVAVYRCSC